MTQGKKQFGAFGGVFTPSILTILGVIMYLRLGWVVGNAGMWGAIIIVIIAHVISITTGLSISSIATDKKVGAGGVYYVLSRSLGLPIGGAIGLTLFIGTALSIALYIVGFSESFNAIMGMESHINNIRLTGSIALLVLTIIAFISTSLAIKTQYFILGAIFLSLLSIFLGQPIEADEPISSAASTPDIPLAAVFAIFFPAVTGFTAGIAMSGDLKDPKKSIPTGTIAAIAVGFVVYIGLVIFLGTNVDAESLKTDYNILEKIAWFAPAVIAGIWGATLSSALGGILGGPRILQAMSLDKITPVIFGKEQGRAKEPRIALIVAIIIAEAGVLIGDLDIVARVVSMFYLAAYGFINISFFLESWASADFRPTFKVSKWIGLLGFIATFGVMFQLDAIAMVLALIIIGGIYLWLTRREIALGTGDIWRSVWSTGVKEGLKRLETKEDHKRNWKPNILLFSGNSEARPHLIEFSQALAGRAGLVTNFDLIENPGMEILFTKHKQSISDELLTKYGIFGRQLEVKNIYKGIETIASTFGFSGVDPNTVLMGWARNTKDPIWFAQMTQTLINLDYNVLYMDYDEKRGFGGRQQIDLWWRGMSNNSELMLQLAKFISFNREWRNAQIRILLVNDFNIERRIIENRIHKLLEEFRLQAEIKVIDNHLEKKAFYDILKTHSVRSDLVLIGIPYIVEGSEAQFVKTTNDLTGIIGTTLLVKASTTFDETKLGLKAIETQEENSPEQDLIHNELEIPEDHEAFDYFKALDQKLAKTETEFIENYLGLIAQHYQDLVSRMKDVLIQLINKARLSELNVHDKEFVESFTRISTDFRNEELHLLQDILQQGVDRLLSSRKEVIDKLDHKLTLSLEDGKKVQFPLRRSFIYFNKLEFKATITKALKEFGIVSSGMIIRTKEVIKKHLESALMGSVHADILMELDKDIEGILDFSKELSSNTFIDLRKGDRKILHLTFDAFSNNKRVGNWGSSLFGETDPSGARNLDFINNYASFWYRNQMLFHHRFETGTELKRTKLILAKGSEYILDSIKMKAFEPLHIQSKKLYDLLNMFTDNMGDEKNLNIPELITSQYVMYNYTPQFRSFRKKIGKATEHLPAEVEMMDSGSLININDVQGKDVHTISFSVDKIADYIIESSFISKIQENLENYNQEINEITGELINMVELLKSSFHIFKSSEDKNLIHAQLEQYKKELEEMIENLSLVQNSFEAENIEILSRTESMLDVQHILDQVDILKQYVRKKEIQHGLKGRFNSFKNSVNDKVLQGADLLNKRRESLKRIEFDRQNTELKNTPDVLRSFMNSLFPYESTQEAIPFYYKQLFTGKHLQSVRNIESRAYEIEKIRKSLELHGQGIPGAIMITGPSLSGKSFLTEHIANHYLSGSTYYISPLPGGASSKQELEDAFTRATGLIGNCKSILQKCKANSVFIFSDLELWWINRYKQPDLINEIVDLINEFNLRHEFILNSNVFAFEALRQHSKVDDIISTTVLLRPLTRQELRTEILRRHKLGGLDIYYKGRLVESDRLERKLEQLFSRVHKISKGSIGFALLIWLNCISLDEEGKYQLNLPKVIEFPELKDAEWSNLLLQMLIHHSLNPKRFKFLYHSMGEEWMNRKLSEIQRSMILDLPGGRTLTLNKIIRPYIEEWLQENNMI